MTALLIFYVCQIFDIYISPCSFIVATTNVKIDYYNMKGSINQANCFICRKSIMGFNKLFLS